ncbi:hypothetical protein ERX27_06920 [Macrococcus brunensis]|uniref:DoxX family membrane protein n=1 Tax=Macrococcus brunensis TaxID=198483 RepID=A0A4V3BDE8_9STAP|nr:hypothetical protein [Macrococcus brunensis]TDL96755.1 hypothetical protein ERX27_06920 [Macrococcus brunensis]ULG73990.1 hypothetical protein MGG13_10125 [Macrococcus brunensis]
MIRRLVYGLAYTTAGVLHFVHEPSFTKIVPPKLPLKKEIVYLTGVMEIFFGLGMILRKPGPLFKAIIKLFLVAVFPANVYMAIKKIGLGDKQLSPAALWGRLPLQWLLIKEMDKL